MDSVYSLLSASAVASGQIIVIDALGNLKVVPQGTALKPGEVVVSNGDDQITVDGNDLPSASIVGDDLSLTELNLDDEINQIFAALESGEDPTQFDDEFAPAAGEASSGSSLTTSGEIERTGAQTLASTSFDTSALQSQGLSQTQSLTLLESYRSLISTDDAAPESELPVITVADISETEDSTPLFSGTATNVNGDLTLTVNGKDYTVTPEADGSWSFELPQEDALADGAHEVTVTGQNAQGDSSSASDQFSVDVKPQVTIVDQTVSESNTPVFSGTSSNTDGDLTVNVNGKDYSVTPDSDGNWTLPLPAEDALDDGDYTVVVTGSDAQGNSATDSDSIQIDANKPLVSISDQTVTADNTPLFSGTSSHTDGDLTLTVNGKGYSVTPNADGSWSFELPAEDALPDATYDVVIKGSDSQGNEAQDTDEFVVDATAPEAPNISLDNDTGTSNQDFLTKDGSFSISDIENGATVEYFVDGSWTTSAPTPVEGENTITVRQTDDAGNSSESSSLTFTLDTKADSGVVSIDDITSDDVITVTEKGQTIAVTGSAVGGDIQSGDTVTAEINGKTYTTTVGENGKWQLDVNGEDLAADTAFDVSVSSEDAAGNSVESKGSSTHTFDETPVNVNIDINPITDDSVVNAKEVAGTVTITGTVTGETYETAVVTLTVNGVEYTGTVTDGKYSIDVNGSDLQSDSNNVVDAKVDVVNAAGNIGSATSTEFYLVDTFARGTISIDSITDDNVINKSESESTVAITGSVGGDARPGDQVSVVVNGVTYLTTVLSDKSWAVDLQGSELAADSSVTATVTGDDWTGNEFSGSVSKGYVIDTTAPSVPVVNAQTTSDVT
ncbi:Ig-like domain-containing protein, partial [Vibrio tapetis subsp. quintayensis]|uniref:Ig-like domain-containing protein n=1 Tax=Vibrio tapetis TaxID=52443 RepID=UPI0025B5BFC5